jgi:hypothetical protein
MRAIFIEYDPLEIYGSVSNMATINFMTPTVVTVTRNPSQVSRAPYEIYLQSGECPGHYDASRSASGLGTIRLTAPVGWRLVYKVQEGVRKIDYASKCTGMSWGAESDFQYLEDGAAIELQPQKSGESTTTYIPGLSVPSGVKRMHGKKIFLRDVVPYAPPPPPVDGTKTCPDGSVVSTSATCPSPTPTPDPLPYVPPTVAVTPGVYGLQPLHLVAIAGAGIAGAVIVTALVMSKKEGA